MDSDIHKRSLEESSFSKWLAEPGLNVCFWEGPRCYSFKVQLWASVVNSIFSILGRRQSDSANQKYTPRASFSAKIWNRDSILYFCNLFGPLKVFFFWGGGCFTWTVSFNPLKVERRAVVRQQAYQTLATFLINLSFFLTDNFDQTSHFKPAPLCAHCAVERAIYCWCWTATMEKAGQ